MSIAIADTPATIPAGTPPRLSRDGHRVAIQAPSHRKQAPETVELIARTSRGMVVVRAYNERDGKAGKFWSVVHIRLTDAATGRQLTRHDLRDLPWRGAGPDPDNKEE